MLIIPPEIILNVNFHYLLTCKIPFLITNKKKKKKKEQAKAQVPLSSFGWLPELPTYDPMLSLLQLIIAMEMKGTGVSNKWIITWFIT